MKLYDFLKEYGLNANDIKNRINSNQILVNGIPKDRDYNLGKITHVYEQGFFMQKLYEQDFYDMYKNQLIFFGLENLISGESNISNELTEFLSEYESIQISKDNILFIKRDKNKDYKGDFLDIEWNIEGQSKFNRKVDLPKDIDQSEIISNLEKEKEKLEKQLSNKGFINNAPKFKIEAAEKRLRVINSKLDGLTTNESRIFSFSEFEYKK